MRRQCLLEQALHFSSSLSGSSAALISVYDIGVLLLAHAAVTCKHSSIAVGVV